MCLKRRIAIAAAFESSESLFCYGLMGVSVQSLSTDKGVKTFSLNVEGCRDGSTKK